MILLLGLFLFGVFSAEGKMGEVFLVKAPENVEGIVFDTDGLPVPGASVLIEGTSMGTSTDLDGKFELEVTQKDAMLIISFVGMKSKRVKPVFGKEMKIVLNSDQQMIEEVVVTGYQKIDRKLFTGSASVVKAEETLLKGVPDVTRSLQGQVAGVSVNNVSGAFGAAPVITIRGNSSINGTNKPLWVVDGVILEDIVNVSADDLTSGNLSTLLSSGVAGLNPDDIETFQILKDVSATSLYGAQAMNGVIVITTKSGKKGHLSVNYNGSLAIRQRPTYEDFDIMNSADEMSIYRELYQKGWIDITTTARAENFGAMGKMFDEIAQGRLPWGVNGGLNEMFLQKYAISNTDWFNTLFQNSLTQQHSFSINSGGENSRFYASLSYYGDAGATAYDKVNKYTASLKGDFDVTNKFTIGVKLAANIRDQRVPGTKDRTFDPITGEFKRDFDINPFNYALNTARSMRAYDENGNLEYFRNSFAPFNIIYELSHNKVDIQVNDISAQTDLSYKPHKSLNLRATLQGRIANTLREHKIHETANQAEAYRADDTQAIIDGNRYLFKDPLKPNSNAYTILPEGGFYNTEETSLKHIYFRLVGEFTPHITEDHIMNFLGGFEMNYANRYYRSQDGWGIVYDKGGIVVTDSNLLRYLNAQGQKYFSYDEERDRRASFFINGAYSYQGKYIFNAGFRYDGSNQLGSSRNARYLPSWNVSGAWNMQAEEFMRGVEWISLLKPKISYGFNGIMGPNTSAALALFGDQTLRPNKNETYTYIAALANEDLTWEKMQELNLGIDFGFYQNRLFGEIAYYRRKSIDLIDYVTTSGVGGIGIKYGNIGDMESSGVEFTLNTVNIQTGGFSWKTMLNVNFHRSEITKLNNFSRVADAVSNLGAAFLGYPQRGLFSIRYAGLDANGIPLSYDKNDQKVYNIEMQERRGITDWLKYEGPLEPKSYGGMTNTFTYKGFGFSFSLVYKCGNVIRLDDAFKPYYNDYSTFSQVLKNRWILPGDENITNIPAILDKRTYDKINGMNAYDLYNKSTERVAKGDFIRLKDITLSYNFPTNLLKKTPFKSVGLSFQANNLWLIYSDKALNGIDPEFYLSGGVSLPVSRLYTFSLNLGF